MLTVDMARTDGLLTSRLVPHFLISLWSVADSVVQDAVAQMGMVGGDGCAINKVDAKIVPYFIALFDIGCGSSLCTSHDHDHHVAQQEHLDLLDVPDASVIIRLVVMLVLSIGMHWL